MCVCVCRGGEYFARVQTLLLLTHPCDSARYSLCCETLRG